jgi:hypothetical protein
MLLMQLLYFLRSKYRELHYTYWEHGGLHFNVIINLVLYSYVFVCYPTHVMNRLIFPLLRPKGFWTAIWRLQFPIP